MRFALLILILPLVSCGNLASRTSSVEPDLLLVQPLSRTVERVPPFVRHVAQSPAVIGGGIGGMVIGLALNTAINRDDNANSKINLVPSPVGVDPGAIVETMIADHLISQFGARPNVAELFAGSVHETTSALRASQVANLARRRGLSGLVIDVVMLEYFADSTGRNLGLVDEAFVIAIRAQFSLIDIATGTVLAQGICQSQNDNSQPIVNAIADGPGLTALLAEKAAQNCARQLIAQQLN